MSLRVSKSRPLISACSGLMYAGVPMNWRNSVKSVLSVRRPWHRLRDAEVDDLGHRLAIVKRDQHVRGLDVAVQDALLVRVLHGLAHLDEELQSLARREVALVAVLRDRDAAHELHHEVRPAGLGRAAVEHLGDVGVVHQRQRLAFGFEPRDDLARVHAELDDLERDLAHDGCVCSAMYTDPKPPSPMCCKSL
jgi:hypothetical protein